MVDKTRTVRQIIALITVLLKIVVVIGQTCPELPEIRISKAYPESHYTILENNTDPTGNRPNHVVYFTEPSNVVLQCVSRYPVLYDFGSEVKLNQLRYIRASRIAEDVLNTRSYCFKIDIFLYRQNNATGKYTCRMLYNERKATSLFLFMQTTQTNKANPFVNSGEVKVVENPRIVNNWLQIPCIVSNPWVTADLFVVKNGSQPIKLEPTRLRWNPTEGFWLNMTQSPANCTSPECYFVCEATGDYSGRDTVRILRAEKSVTIPNITLAINGHDILCKVPPGVFLKELVMKECSNFMECYNAGKSPLLASDRRGTDCDSDTIGDSTCRKLQPPPFSDYNGITGVIRCTAGESKDSELFSKTWYRFFQLPAGLQVHLTYEEILKIFSNESPLRSSSVLGIHGDTPKEVYIGQSVTIQCIASPFVVAEGIEWLFIMENGTTLGKNQTNFQAKFSIDKIRPNFEMYSTITFTPWTRAIESVVCLGPTWTGYNWINDTRKIHVLDGEAPTFVKTDGGLKKIFYEGEKNFSISCSATGDPKPTITWEKDGKELPPGVLKTNLTEGDALNKTLTTTSTLIFTEATDSIKGEYTCVASTFAGTNYETFFVDVKAKAGALPAVIVGSMLAIVALSAAVTFLYKSLVRQKKIIAQFLSEKEVKEFFYGIPEMVKNTEYDTSDCTQFLPYKKEFEILPKDIKIEEEQILGSGQFGVVLKGTLATDQEGKPVAVKMLKPNTDKEYVKAMLYEIKIMMTIETHPSIVNFIGALTQDIRDGKLSIVVEFCANGSLEKYLRSYRNNFTDQIMDDSIVPAFSNARHVYVVGKSIRKSGDMAGGYVNFDNSGAVTPDLNTITLVTWAHEIASGMEHLASKKVIHADLACRNILVTDRRTVKIADFGLSRQLYESSDYIKKSSVPLPWRWMAIESLRDMNFSVYSDVWAYGITLWELFTLGAVPYPGHNWNEDFLKKLEAGLRVDKPMFTTSKIYSTMLQCMAKDPEERYNFTQVKNFFQELIKSSSSYHAIDYVVIASP